MRKTGTLAAAVAALVLAGAGPLAAETDPEPEQLEAQAERVAADYDRLAEAASLYRAAADLRFEGDPQRVADLLKAGKLSFYAGDARRAIDDLREAAEVAHAYGDVATAARAYVDAAWVAREAGHGSSAVALAIKGRKLSHSPLIPEALRHELQARVTGEIM